MARGKDNRGEQGGVPNGRGKCFWRFYLLTPFILLFLMIFIASIVQVYSSAKVLEKESTFLGITKDDHDIHTTTTVALCGGVSLLTAVVFGTCLMIVICALRGEEKKYEQRRGMLLGVLLLIMCIFLLGGMGLSLSTSGYELLHFNHKDDFQAKFKRGAMQSLRDYNMTHQLWDTFQKENECCGVNSWRDYDKVLSPHVVPASCCNPLTVNSTQCNQVRMSVNSSDVYIDHYIYSQGCSTVVYKRIGGFLQLMYRFSVSAGTAACVCVLFLIIALIAICIRSKLQGSDYEELVPNFAVL